MRNRKMNTTRAMRDKRSARRIASSACDWLNAHHLADFHCVPCVDLLCEMPCLVTLRMIVASESFCVTGFPAGFEDRAVVPGFVGFAPGFVQVDEFTKGSDRMRGLAGNLSAAAGRQTAGRRAGDRSASLL